MVLMDNTQALALIERAERAAPFCDCGEPMAPVARSAQVWLECTTQIGSDTRRPARRCSPAWPRQATTVS